MVAFIFFKKITEMVANYDVVIVVMSAQRTAEVRLIVKVHQYIV